MEIKITRTWKTDESIIGCLYVYNDKDKTSSIFKCFTLEDVERDSKVWGKTSIPKGRYKVTLTYSSKFGRNLFMLENVKNFSRIYFHEGNWAKDTEGCILLGLIRNNNFLEQSKIAVTIFESLLKKVYEKEQIWVTIE